MSHQVCHCGWSKKTTYQGLRIHQGKMGCTPKGMNIPQSEQFRFNTHLPNFTYVGPPINIEDPVMTIFTPPFMSERDQHTWRNLWQDSHQNDSGPNSWITPVRNENVSPNLTALTTETEAEVMEIIKSFKEMQQNSLQMNTHKSHRALDFASGAQMSQIFGAQASPAAAEVTVKETNKSLFETPPHGTTTHQTTANVRRALDFSTGAQQPSLTQMPQIFGTQASPAAAEVTMKETNRPLFQTPPQNTTTHQTTANVRQALDFSTGAQQPSLTQMSQIFGTQASPSATQVPVKETTRPLFQTPPQNTTTHQTTANARQAHDFSTDAQQPLLTPMSQIFGTQASPAAMQVPVKETNRSLFQTPPHDTTTHQTTANARQAHDFSTGAQQPSLMPMTQIFGTQASPAAAEVTVKETNKSLFQTPTHDTTTHQTTANARRAHDFSTGAQQPSLMPMTQIFGTQASPAAAEVPVKETTRPLFQTPPQNTTTHQTTANVRQAHDFSTGAQQVGQQLWDVPTTTAQETAVQLKEREKEKEREREAQKLQKMRQDRIAAGLQQKIQTREQKMAEVRSSVKACKGGLDAEWLEINNVFSEVMRVVEDARQKALQPLEERRQRVKRGAQYLVQKLQNEIDELKKTIDELDKNPNLQDSSLEKSQHWENVIVDTSFSFGSLRTTTSNMVKQIHQKLEKLSPVELKRIPTFAVDVKLDPTTAHKCLALSDDGKMVKDRGTNQGGPDAPQRFDMFGSILGLNRLTSGKSYWEVEVTNKTGWDLGVARRNANRKGKLSLSPDNGYWVTVHYEGEKYAALTTPPVPLPLKEKPQKVGVFVDYEEGLVSFYDVTAQSHIYSFTECSFSDEIFPYFSPHLKQNGKNSHPLIISAVKRQQ